MSESEKPFTVSDRRHFTPDGRLRNAAEHEDVPESGPAPPAGTETPPPETQADAAEKPSPSAPPTEQVWSAPAEEADFAQFLLSLGAQAGLLLSGQGLPEGAEASEALAGARSIISILEMLREKTQGHRTPREDEVLEGLLYELRMAYVEASRASGS